MFASGVDNADLTSVTWNFRGFSSISSVTQVENGRSLSSSLLQIFTLSSYILLSHNKFDSLIWWYHIATGFIIYWVHVVRDVQREQVQIGPFYSDQL